VAARGLASTGDDRSLHGHRQDWEELAQVDPLWSILSAREGRGGRWQLEAFFASGESEIDEALAAPAAAGRPHRHERALDFGCGVGRVTRALADRFAECYGVDISSRMIELAQDLNADRPSCSFLLNDRADLSQFESGSFDLVYSTLVLQHLPRPSIALGYISEFLRVVRPDGLVFFQIPHRIPWPYRLHLRRRLWLLFRAAGVGEHALHDRLRLTPMRMIAVPEPAVRRAVGAAGGKVEWVQHDEAGLLSVESRRYAAYPQ
jgi:SAM-dependent methyltransferase